MRVFGLSGHEARNMFKAYQLLDTVCRCCNLCATYIDDPALSCHTKEMNCYTTIPRVSTNLPVRITDISILDDQTWQS